MKTEQEKKELLRYIIKEFKKSDISDEIVVWDEIVNFYSEGDIEIKNKAYNLLKLINETKQKSIEEFNKLMKKDIEDDLWYII